MKAIKILTILVALLLTSCNSDNHKQLLTNELSCVQHRIIDSQSIVKDGEVLTKTTVFTVQEIRVRSTLKEDGERHEYNDTITVKYAVNDFGVESIK